MNLNKLFKIAVLILFTQFGSNAIQGMVPVNAPVEVYFLPKNVNEFNQRLMGLLDNAKDHVFVAMYWLTDQRIIDKLISVKKRGIDVQIIFDQSMDKKKKVDDFVRQLLQNKIIPYVSPTTLMGLMHNKFVVIDGRFVVTGSANFTATALNEINFPNNENIMIFNSNEIAAKYGEEFLRIQGKIAEFYVDAIARQELADWMKKIIPILYEKDDRFRNLVDNKFNKYGQDQQRRLTQFFNLQPQPVVVAPEFSSQEESWDESDVIIFPVQSVPAIQRPVVVAPEFSSEEEPWKEDDVIISGTNPRPAIIDLELDSEFDGLEYPVNPLTQHQIDEPLTYVQKYFLENRNINTFGMSKQRASQIIGDIKRAESRPY